MTAQQLKNSILQMAMQGKLVPQDPGDEPASVLLQRIKAEKQELIKAGKIKKDKKSSEIFRGASRNLPYAYCEQIGKEIRDISDEIPFEIPDSWEWCRLGTIATVLGGKRIPAGRKLSLEKTDHIYIRVSDMKENTISLDNLQYVPDDIYPSISRYIINKEDIYITVAGTIGKVGKIPPELDGANLTENADRLVFRELNRDWFIMCLQSCVIQSQIADATTKVGQPKLAIARIQNLLIPVPPLSEQHRIVAKIEELLPYIERYGKAEEHLTALNTTFPEALKKSILQEAVQGKLVPQNPDDEPASVLLERIRAEKQALIKAGKIKRDRHESVIVTRDKIPYEIIDGKERCIADEVPFELPESWCWCRLGTITTVLGGKRIPAGRKLSLEKTDHIYIRVSDMKDSGVSMDNLQYVPDDIYPSISRYIINKEDIYITVAGTIGKVGKIPPELDGANLTENADRLVFSIINQDWLIMCLQSSVVQSQIADATTKVGQPKLAIARIQNLFIPLPPVDEQSRIVTKIEEIMPYINTISK